MIDSEGARTEIVYGMNPVREALRRPEFEIREVWVAEGRGRASLAEILAAAGRRSIPVAYKRRVDLDRRAGGGDHQGVLALCRAFSYAGWEEVAVRRHEAFRDHCLLILDGVMDPRNLGAMIRTAHAFGVNGVILPENRAAAMSPAVVKASAGAASCLPVARVVNLARTIDALKARGFWIYGADMRGEQGLEDLRMDGDVALVMGGEGKGIRPLVRRQLDFTLSIDMVGGVDSLNVSVAAGIILHAMMMRRSRT